MTGQDLRGGVACTGCGMFAAHHLDCGDPCCGRCSHPDWEEGMTWVRRSTSPVMMAAENSGGWPLTPDENGGMVGSGLPAKVSPLKRMALPELVGSDDPWGDQ